MALSLPQRRRMGLIASIGQRGVDSRSAPAVYPVSTRTSRKVNPLRNRRTGGRLRVVYFAPLGKDAPWR
jgi:hypothetical protein